MQRRNLVQLLAALPAASLLGGCLPDVSAKEPAVAGSGDIEPLDWTLEQWRSVLPTDRYQVLFEEATERRFTSPLNDEKRPGTFICAACYLPLFESRHKYDSGTGWPSFTQPIEGHIGTKQDFKLFLPRTEYHCVRCKGHQGHVVNDGPKPRGERWCNNGLALLFVPEEEALPALRV